MKNSDNKAFETVIDMTNVETKRTYVFSDGTQQSIENFSGLIVHDDNSHTIVTDTESVDVDKSWIVFYAETPVNDFSFSVVKDVEAEALETWMCMQGIEKSRTYWFGEFSYTISRPSKVYIKKSGSHKIVDENGVIHYISKGFDKMDSER